MKFKKVIQQTPGVGSAYCKGLSALTRSDKDRISVCKRTKICGSVNIDEALKSTMPNDPRWDYVIGYVGAPRQEKIIWIEVHPASTGEIEVVLRKLQWLKNWLSISGPNLSAFNQKFIWISSGATTFTGLSPQAKTLSSHGLRNVGGHYCLHYDS